MTTRSYLIRDFMTPQPHAIEPHEPVAAARERMRQLRVQHMPVRAAGRAIGLLSERDLAFLEGLATRTDAAGLGAFKVMDVMVPDPFCVAPDMPLHDVADVMSREKIGSALVVEDDGRLLGIFTVTDALKALSRVT